MSTLTTIPSEDQPVKADLPLDGMHLIHIGCDIYDDRYCIVPDGTDDTIRQAFYEAVGYDPVQIICQMDPEGFLHKYGTNPQNLLSSKNMPPRCDIRSALECLPTRSLQEIFLAEIVRLSGKHPRSLSDFGIDSSVELSH